MDKKFRSDAEEESVLCIICAVSDLTFTLPCRSDDWLILSNNVGKDVWDKWKNENQTASADLAGGEDTISSQQIYFT